MAANAILNFHYRKYLIMKKYNNEYSDEESVYNETDDMFEGEDISNEEVPDFVQKFAEKQDKEEHEEKVFAAKVCAGIAVAVGLIFYLCWKKNLLP